MAQRPKYPHVANELINRIKSGEYPLGGNLPTLDEITELFNISRMTAENALKLVVQKGYASSSRGRKSRIISREAISFEDNFTNKNIAILGHFDVEVHSIPPISQRILFYLHQKLISLGNHVMCFQYHEDLDLKPNDIDGYVMIDLMGYRSHFKKLIAETGKAYVVIDCLMYDGTEPNHIHLFYQSVLLKAVNYLLSSKMTNFIFFNVDPKSVSKAANLDQLNETGRFLCSKFVVPITNTLSNYGLGQDCFAIYNTSYHPEDTARQIEKLIQQNRLPKNTAFFAASEHIAIGIYKTLKSQGWKPNRDFMIMLLNPAGRSLASMQEVMVVDISMQEIWAQVLKSFDHQFLKHGNRFPGSIVEVTFNPQSPGVITGNR